LQAFGRTKRGDRRYGSLCRHRHDAGCIGANIAAAGQTAPADQRPPASRDQPAAAALSPLYRLVRDPESAKRQGAFSATALLVGQGLNFVVIPGSPLPGVPE